MNDAANAAIPADIREQFQRDEQGRILFFTAPPVDVKALRTEKGEGLGHSVEYLAGKTQRDEKVREARKRRAEERRVKAEENAKRLKREQVYIEQRSKRLMEKAVGVWEQQISKWTEGDFARLMAR